MPLNSWATVRQPQHALHRQPLDQLTHVPAGVASLSVDARLTIANMTTEWGALAGVFPTDDVLLSWLYDRGIDLTTRPMVRFGACQKAYLIQCSNSPGDAWAVRRTVGPLRPTPDS